MHFLKKYEKTAIYNITALAKTTNKMNIDMHKNDNMHQLCIRQRVEALTHIKMFVQNAKGNDKIVAMFFSLSPN